MTTSPSDSAQPFLPTNQGEPLSPPLPSIRWEDISRGASEVKIQFRGQTYRLRVTKNGKLILNK